jgi:putative PIN family toxin of toxin-antitoxin system
MTTDLQTVIDTSVVVSAVLLPRSVPRQAFDRAMAAGKILLSTATLDELNEVLRRPRFEKYLREAERLEFLAALVAAAKIIEVTETFTDCRDPRDNKFLELAVSAQASYIISGDQDLLVLNPFRSIPIVTRQTFLTLV